MARGAHPAPASPVSTWLLFVPLLLLVLLPLLSVGVVSAHKNHHYEFQVELYDQPLSWQKCPEGWKQHGKKCYKVFIQHVSWPDANKVCRSLGGCLAKIPGFNQNQGLGWLLQNALAEEWTEPTDRIAHAATAGDQQVWIGLTRGSSGNYVWSNGSPGYEQQGFWDKGNPPAFSNSIHVNEQCCDISLNSTELGQFRWHLGGCDRKRMFVCEVKACSKRHFRCANGLKCVREKSICDGVQDCDDGSDERTCGNDNLCGGNMDGERGTFHSPGYPKKYPKQASCMWRIQTPVGTKVQLHFESFDIERKYDNIEVYDGSEREASALLGRYNGKHIPLVPLATSNFLLVILTSDRSKEADGFQATWSAVDYNDGQAGTCGGLLTAQHYVQSFTTPLFPSPYPDNLVCDWVISAPSPDDIITLQFQDFETESEHDWIEVRNGQTEESKLFGRFSGTQLPTVLTSTGPNLFLRFNTDFKQSFKGFNATYSTGCNVDISSGYAKIESPGYGVDSYPSNVDCTWRLIDPENRQLNLVFNSLFDTEPTMDVVKVYNSSQGSAPYLAAELSGTMSPEPVRSRNSAYVITFSSDATVQRSGWSASVSFDCSALQNKDPLLMSTTSVVFGTVVQFGCVLGYTLDGDNFTECGLQGQWTNSLPSCQLIECGSPEVPKHGYLVSVWGTTFGEKAFYNCSKGFTMEGGIMDSTCGQDGWSLQPKCEEIYCPKEPPPLHSSAMAEDSTYGGMREYFCNEGYQLEGAKFSYCTADGEWTHPVPECHLLECPAIAGIIHGSPDPVGPVRVGEVVSVTCQEGYHLEGQGSLTCLPSLDYHQPVPYCRDLDECQMVGMCADDVQHTCQNLVGSYRCLCQHGYQHPDGDPTVCEDIDECLAENGGCNHFCNNTAGSYQCNCRPGFRVYQGDAVIINGGLLVPNKSCIAPCPSFKVSGGEVAYTGSPLHGGLHLHPTEAVIACPADEIPDGPARLLCQEEGGWSDTVTQCLTALCPALETLMNGKVLPSGIAMPLDSNVTYICDTGFRLKGPAVRFCQRQKVLATSEQKLMWTGPQPSCNALDCGPPPQPDNGLVVYSGTALHSVATYSCRCGFQLHGESTISCLPSGLWSGNNTQCHAQSCPYPGKPAFGSMVESNYTYPVDSLLHFQCNRPGFKLSDPWPMRCLSAQSYQVSRALPLYQVSIVGNFVTTDSSSVSAPCGSYYQGAVVRLLRSVVPQLQLLCVQHGQPMISVNDDTLKDITDKNIKLTGWYELKSYDKEDLTSICSCGRAISSTLSNYFSSIPMQLEASQELGCPVASLQRNSVDTSEHGWRCPNGDLQVGDGQCGQGVPACTEACVSEPLPVITPTAPAGATTASPFFTTTPAPVHPSATTTIVITMPTLPPLADTFSTPTTTVTTPSQTTASSTVEEEPKDSTIKDITTRSTTFTPLEESGTSKAGADTTTAFSTPTATTTTPAPAPTVPSLATSTAGDPSQNPYVTTFAPHITSVFDTLSPNTITDTHTPRSDGTTLETSIDQTSTQRTSSSVADLSTLIAGNGSPTTDPSPAEDSTEFTTVRPLTTIYYTTPATSSGSSGRTVFSSSSQTTNDPQPPRSTVVTTPTTDYDVFSTTQTATGSERTEGTTAETHQSMGTEQTAWTQQSTEQPGTTGRPETTLSSQVTEQGPQATEESQTTDEPQTTERLTITTDSPQDQGHTDGPVTSQALHTTQGPHTTKIPGTSQDPHTTQAMLSTEETQTTGKQHEQTTERPQGTHTTERPQDTQRPQTTERPQEQTTESQQDTEGPHSTYGPQSTGQPQASDRPQETQGPETTQRPQTQAPQSTETPQATQTQEDTHTPDWTQTPYTTLKPFQQTTPQGAPEPDTTHTIPIPQTTFSSQRPTTQAPERPTTQAPERPTTQAPERPTTQAPERPTTQAPERPTTQAPERPTTQAPERPTTQAPERPITQAPERPTTQAPERPTTKAPEIPTTQAPERPTTQAPERPTTQAPERPTTQAPERPTTQAPERHTTQAPEIPTTQAPERPTTQAPERPTTQAPERPTTQAPERPTTQAPERPTTQAPERPTTQAPERPTTQAPLIPTTQAPERPTTQAPEIPTTQAPERPTTQAPERPTTQAPEIPTTQAPERPTTQAPERPTTQAPERPTTQAPERPTTQAPERPTTQAPERLTTQAPERPTTMHRQAPTSGQLDPEMPVNTGETSAVMTEPEFTTDRQFLDMAWPLFLIEVEDDMEGSFTNVTCIDEVHLDINSKVNEVMREFITDIGHTACLNASDVTLELMSGNIRFRGEKAKIFIQFSMKYRSSQPQFVESCASEFREYVLRQLPDRFQLVSQQMDPARCTEMTYVPGSTKVSKTSWTCPKGYQLESKIFVCQRISSTPFNSLSSVTPTPSAASPPKPVNTIPRMTLTFLGTFTQTSQLAPQGMTECISEYNSGLMSLLRDLESHVQSHVSDCWGIYVDVTTNLSVTVHESDRLKATAQVRLLPVKEGVDLPAMHTCARYVNSQFKEPEKHLPNVTLPVSYLGNCSPIELNPPTLTSDAAHIVFSCAEGFIYDPFNFLCINEARPSHKVEIDLTITGLQMKGACRQAVEGGSKQLSQQVAEDAFSRLNTGRLCNASLVGDRVVQLPRNSALSLLNTEATISIPFVLLSLSGQQAPVEKCKGLLYAFLAASLGDPLSTMMHNVSAACPDALPPRNYTRAAEEWGCFEGRVYSAQTHSCDKFGALEESITKTKGLMSERRRRNAGTSPYWNTTLPTCTDQEPPAFSGCPKESVEVRLGSQGPVPWSDDLPTPSDNSEGALTVTYQPPGFNLMLPYTFRENMTVNITAVDPAGNKAVCRISFHLIDVTPPVVQCPRDLFRHHYRATDAIGGKVAVVYPTGVVSATDYGGVSRVVFNPVPGTLKEVLKEFEVTATAFDMSGNSATCSFDYLAGTDSCALWELPIPAEGQGQRACTSEIEGSVGFGVSCNVACPHGYYFISPPPAQYLCINNSTWQPHNYVPQCGALSWPNYNLTLALNFTYTPEGGVTPECSDKVCSSILTDVKKFFATACLDTSSLIDFKFEPIGMPSGPYYLMKMLVSITLKEGTTTNAAKECGTEILGIINEFSPQITDPDCGNASFLPPIESQGQSTCYPGYVYVKEQLQCLKCPMGTFMNETGKTCEQCPLGQFQNMGGQVSCYPCPSGHTTLDAGSTGQAQCLEVCQAGYYSGTGLGPCRPCGKGTYQSQLGQMSCSVCEDGFSTQYPASASSADCITLCYMGYYSSSGLAPCSGCPFHHYSDQRGMTSCTECPPTKATIGKNQDSLSDCLVVEQCRNSQCNEGATCIDRHRFAECICPPGLNGTLCKEDIDECASQPCANGGTCENGFNTFTCRCPPGYNGDSCESEVDECSSNPCVHGVCADGDQAFSCLCYNGYTGKLCDVDIDECTADLCLNGGQCLDMVAGYQCDCSGTGFEGSRCEQDVADCSESSCFNNGICHDLVNSFNCSCIPGFAGENCEEDLDDCHPNPCAYSAMCLDKINSYECICKPGYTGHQCKVDIDECSSNPCYNEGSCSNLVNEYLCTCLPGYDGKDCQINLDDCASGPCSPEGTDVCEDGVNNFVCHCLTLWEGELCDVQADPCLTSPCAEGATCTAVEDNFVCVCPPDFTGTLCDHHLDDCESGPCMNNGSCVDGVHSFSCGCGAGFAGEVCDVNVDECLSQLCSNGATCRDLINGFTCSCAPGYAGELCEEDIDDCASLPCANGGTCQDGVDQYRCLCSEGYSGQSCREDIDECKSSPCLNGGTCINLDGDFYCECPAAYRGDLCQQDPCTHINTCLNNATCVGRPGGVTCLCPAHLTGADCGKEKSGDFDLQFHGKPGAACRPPDLVVPTMQQLAVCLWLRYAAPDATATVFTLTARSDDNNNDLVGNYREYVMLELGGGSLWVSLQGEQDAARYPLPALTDGHWHHLCYQCAANQHAVYLDGARTVLEDYYLEAPLPTRISVVLGQPSNPAGQPFQGEISQFNVFSSTLNSSEIASMGGNCSESQPAGDVYAWPVSDSYLEGDVTVVAPAICGESQCPPGFYGTYCDMQADKTSPTVEACPGDQTITNTSAMVTVLWAEPEFKDNVGIVSVQQTHRSGQAFRQGEYVVTYIAYDAENNSAECTFQVIIRPFDCVEPAAPVNGGKVCQTWLHGSFCSIACFPSYLFLELPPPFYTCGQLGFWDPPRGNPFRFPPCSLMFEPEVSLVGTLEVSGPGCTEVFRAALKAKFSQIMTELDAALGLCKSDFCDFENSLSVTCDGQDSGRKKRQASASFQVALSLDMAANSSAVHQSNGDWAAEQVLTAVKQGRFNDALFTADPGSARLSVDYLCQPGQVLRVVEGEENVTRACVDCPAGYHFNSSAGDCELCLEGSYSSQPRQFQCQTCPPGTTTTAPGSTSVSQCLEVCTAGSHYSVSAGGCEQCPAGQYQDSPGQTACLNCPVGQSTERPGATAVQQCGNVCELGQEVSGAGQCQPCPRGSYQESRQHPVCLSCPYGWTTPHVGATSQALCNVVVCERGHRWTAGNQCELCPTGSYQSQRGADRCVACGAGLTTAGPGAVSRDQCRSGPVDECALGAHSCDTQASCVDTEASYKCLCLEGFTGDGFNCSDMCDNYCQHEGECAYGEESSPFCHCKTGYTGQRCQEEEQNSAGLSSAVAGGIAGSVVAVFVIIIVTGVCYWKHRAQRKKSNDRIYRSTPAAFYNEGYESVRDSIGTPSQLMVREQSSSTSSSSSLSIAPRWNRSTFANSDEEVSGWDMAFPLLSPGATRLRSLAILQDEADACWLESINMDDLSLGSDSFTRTSGMHAETYL